MVYFALGDAGLFYIAPYRGAPIGDLIMSVMILAPPVIIFIIMAFYFSGQTTKIEKSVAENSKYIGSSSGILFHLKEREGPSQRQRDESPNKTPITYMQYYIIVQDSVNYSPPEIV